MLYAANLAFIFAYGAYFLLPVHLRALGASDGLVGLITASTGVTNALALVWLITKAFKKDPRDLMLLGIALFGAGCVGVAFTENFYAIAFMRMLHGAGFCLYFIAANTWLSHHSPQERLARDIGFLGVVTQVAQSIAPLLAEALVGAAGYNAMFFATVALCVLSYLIARTLAPTPADTAAPEGALNQRPTPMAPSRLAVLALFAGATFGVVVTFSPLYLIDHKIVPVSLFFTVYAASAVAVRLIWRDAADSVGHLRIARMSMLALAVATLAMSYATGPWGFGAASALYGMAHGFMYPALAAYSVNAVKGSRLKGMALWAGGFAVGVSLGAWMAGYLAEAWTIETAFRVGSLLPFFALAAAWTPKSSYEVAFKR